MGVPWNKTYQKLHNGNENNEIAAIYFLSGIETFFADQIVKKLQAHPYFLDREKIHVFFGGERSFSEILMQAREIPMQGGKQLILVKNAQLLKKEISKLEEYAQKPSKFTVLVLCFAATTPNSKWFQNLSKNKNAAIFSINTIYENQLPEVISLLGQENEITLSEEGIREVIAYSGNQLYKIQNILHQLKLTQKKGRKIEAKDVKSIHAGERSYSEFDLQKAVALHQKAKAFVIVQHLSQDSKNHPLIKAIGILYRFVKNLLKYHGCKDKSEQNIAKVLSIHPFFVREFQSAARAYSLKKTVKMLESLHNIDLKAKGISGSATSSQSCELLKDWVTLTFE